MSVATNSLFSVNFPSNIRQTIGNSEAVSNLINSTSELRASIGAILSIKESDRKDLPFRHYEGTETITFRNEGGYVFKTKVGISYRDANYGQHYSTIGATIRFKSELVYNEKITISLTELAIYKLARPYEYGNERALVELLGQMKKQRIFNKELSALYKEKLNKYNQPEKIMVSLYEEKISIGNNEISIKKSELSAFPTLSDRINYGHSCRTNRLPA